MCQNNNDRLSKRSFIDFIIKVCIFHNPDRQTDGLEYYISLVQKKIYRDNVSIYMDNETNITITKHKIQYIRYRCW